MIVGKDILRTEGFGTLWRWADREPLYKVRPRDYGIWTRDFVCPVCKAGIGEPCTRPTAKGIRVVRGLSHLDRGAQWSW